MVSALEQRRRIEPRVAADWAIETRGVNFAFARDAQPTLIDIDLALAPGEMVILTGPSGAGKTTLMTLVGALRTVQSGSIRVLGQELAGL
jgi:putative ABC transport system ATP-binding protein